MAKRKNITAKAVRETEDLPVRAADLTLADRDRFERLAESEDDGAWRTKWRLTLKQRRWAKAYVGRAKGNGTEAARLAGFSDDNVNYLSVVGTRMLRNAKVLRYVAYLLNRNRGGPREVLAGIAELATTTAESFIAFDDNDNPYVDLAKARDAAALGAVRELVEESTTYDGKDGQPGYTERRLKVKLYDRQKAQESLAKINGQIKGTLEVSGTVHHKHDVRPLLEKLVGDPGAYGAAKNLAERLAGPEAASNAGGN